MTTCVDSLNYLAIFYLEKLGNVSPTQDQIDLMEFFIGQIFPFRQVH